MTPADSRAAWLDGNRLSVSGARWNLAMIAFNHHEPAFHKPILNRAQIRPQIHDQRKDECMGMKEREKEGTSRFLNLLKLLAMQLPVSMLDFYSF